MYPSREEEEEIVENGLVAFSIMTFSLNALVKQCIHIIEEDMMKRGEYITVSEV